MAFGKAFGMRVPGIYKIINTENGKFYIGSSVNVEFRILKHLSHLRRNVHRNAHLQAAFNRYGEDAFDFQLMEICQREQLLEREQHYIDTLRPDYNVCLVAGNTLGYKHTDQAKAKMSMQRIGTKRRVGVRHSEETRKLLSQLASQRKMSDAHRARMSEVNRGNKHTAGRELTEEHKAKVSAGLREAWSGSRSNDEAAARLRARWADPEWKAQQSRRIQEGKAAKRAQRGLE